LLGTALDGIHAYGDVLTYPNEAFGQWAWFVPVEFGLLGAGMGLAMPLLERRIAPGLERDWGIPRAAGEVALFALLYLCTALVDGHGAWPTILAIALSLLALARLTIERVPGDWFYAVVACIAGPLAEALLSETGAFHYEHADFASIPIWLAPLWANGGLMLRRVLAPIVLSASSR